MAQSNYPSDASFINPMGPWPVNDSCKAFEKLSVINDQNYNLLKNKTEISKR